MRYIKIKGILVAFALILSISGVSAKSSEDLEKVTPIKMECSGETTFTIPDYGYFTVTSLVTQAYNQSKPQVSTYFNNHLTNGYSINHYYVDSVDINEFSPNVYYGFLIDTGSKLIELPVAVSLKCKYFE